MTIRRLLSVPLLGGARRAQLAWRVCTFKIFVGHASIRAESSPIHPPECFIYVFYLPYARFQISNFKFQKVKGVIDYLGDIQEDTGDETSSELLDSGRHHYCQIAHCSSLQRLRAIQRLRAATDYAGQSAGQAPSHRSRSASHSDDILQCAVCLFKAPPPFQLSRYISSPVPSLKPPVIHSGDERGQPWKTSR